MWLAMAMALMLAPTNTSDRTRFDLSDDGAIVVKVMVQEQGPFRFLLDTGASQSIISERLARRLGVAEEGRTTMVTPGGHRTNLPVTRLASIDLGSLRVGTVVATVVADGLLASHGRIDGVLGQNVLAPQVYTISYSRKTILWRATSPKPHRVTLPAELDNGRMFVLMPQPGGGGMTLKLIPDTGSDGLVLFARPGRLLPPMTPLDVGMLRTVSGQRLVRRVLVDVHLAGGVELRDQMALLVPRTDADGPDGDGLLPLHLFSDVIINGPAGWVALER